MKRMTWHEYFMRNALLISSRATCDRLRVGAIIVKDARIIATGYNGSVTGEVHCIDEGCLVEDGHCIRTVHAEMNALLQCVRQGISSDGAVIYVTHFPCVQCMKSLVQAGIKAIYYNTDYHNHDYSLELLRKAGIDAYHIDENGSLIKVLYERNDD